MKPKEMVKFLVSAIKDKHPILIKGPPGIGKTDIVKEACRIAGAQLYFEFPAISDPTDGKGVPFSDGNGFATWLQFKRHHTYCTTEELTVVFLDDIGQAPPAVQASYMQWILARRIGDNKVSDNVCFIAATNERSHKAGVSGMLEPVKSRFKTIVTLEVDLDQWIEWAVKNGMPDVLVSFIKFRPIMLHNFKPTQDLVNTPSPRTNENVGRLYNTGIDRSSKYEVIAGAAGEAYASEFLGFEKIWKSLPNINIIISDPDSVEVPDDPATLYAICGLLASKANEDNIKSILQYIDRFTKREFAAMVMNDILIHEPTLGDTPEYRDWVIKNQDVVI